MSSVVNVGGWEVSSNAEGAESMAEALKPEKDDGPQPEIKADRGKEVESEKDDETRRAASTLGKKGGEAAARARAEKAAAEGKADDKGGEAKPDGSGDTRKGNPRHDPEARVREATSQLAEERRLRAEERARLEKAERELEELRRGAGRREADEGEERPRAQAPDDDPEPNEDDYDGSPGRTWSDYQRDARAWDRRQVKRELAAETAAQREVESRAETLVQTLNTKVQAHQKRMQDHMAADPTFEERVSKANMGGWVPSYDPSMIGKDPNLQNLITDELIESKHGHLLIGHIADTVAAGDLADLTAIADAGRSAMREMLGLGYDMKNPREKELVFAHCRAAIAREMVRLESRLVGGTSTQAPRAEASRAKPPIATVKAASRASVPDLHGDIDLDTFVARSKG